MFFEDIVVIRINDCCFMIPFKECLWISHEKLIKGILYRYEYDQRFLAVPANTSGTLPCTRNRARISAEDTAVKDADINPQFEGAG